MSRGIIRHVPSRPRLLGAGLCCYLFTAQVWIAAAAYSSTYSTFGHPGKVVPSAAKIVRYLYLFGEGGDFVKIDLDGIDIAAFWRLSELDRVKPLMREYEPPNPVLMNLRYDPVRERVYAVVVKPPRAADAQADHPADFAILVLDVPGMNLITHIDVETPSRQPVVLVSPGGDRLLVNYPAPATSGAQEIAVLEQYDTSSWERVRVGRDTIGVPQGGVLLSDDAYFAEEGKGIYDDCRWLQLADDKLVPHPPEQPEGWMTEAQTSDLKRHGVDPSTPSIEHCVGRVRLFDQPNQSGTKDVVWAVSAMTHAMSAIIEVPSKSAVSLIGDGKRLVVEEAMGPSPGEKEPRPEASGRLRVYDLATGTVLTEWKKKDIAPEGTPAGSICPTPDGNTLFYLMFRRQDDAFVEDVYALDLVRHVSRRVPTSGLRLGFSRCIFANR